MARASARSPDVIEDVGSGEWGIAGKPATTTDIKELLQAGQKVTAGT
jgi:hypothetical protein